MSKETNKEFTFKKYAWQQFKANKPGLFSMYILIILIVVAIFSPIIANQQPLYVKYAGNTYFPAFKNIINESFSDSVVNPGTGVKEELVFNRTDWRTLELESVIWPLIPYSADQYDRYARDYVAPSDQQTYKSSEGMKDSPWILRHHLGTDALGRDVASGLIHGTKISLMVGVISMGIASIIGVLLGAFAGYFGDTGLRITRVRKWMIFLGLFLGFYYGFLIRSNVVSESFNKGIAAGLGSFAFSILIFSFYLTVFNIVGRSLKLKGYLGRLIPIKVDSYVSRGIEVLNSLPNLLLIITVAAIMKERSLGVLMVIIGATSWTGIARFTRAEFMRLREMEFIQAAKALGYSNKRIIFKHGLPNGLSAVFVSIAFGVASAILTESSLSFLGIGVPDDVVTWGSLLSLGKEEFEAWWLVLYPGLAIFITITIYNLIGEGLRDALDPKLKR
jgi:peptide/nickel transport system permease protein